jgi:rhomboid protease GluP
LVFQLRQSWTKWREPLLRLPLVTILLIVTNVVLYSLIAPRTATAETLQFALEMNGMEVIRGQWWRLLTGTFLHLNLPHLISNLVLIGLLGFVAERLFRHFGMLLLWLTTAVASFMAELMVKGPRISSFGSSGVFFGLAGALLSVYLLRRVTISTRSRYLWICILAVFILFTFLGDWYVSRRINLAHAGGLIAGIFLGLMLPTGSTPWRLRPGLMFAAACGVLVVAAVITGNRQGVWVELDEIEMQFAQFSFASERSSIARLEQIVSRHPDILRAHVLLAEALQADNRYDDAIREYRSVVEKQPAYARAWYGMGEALMNSHHPQQAIDAFSRNLELISATPITSATLKASRITLAREALAEALKAAGKTEAARQQFIEILRETPEDSLAAEELKRLEQTEQLSVVKKQHCK